jgi:hypothetical protein
LGGAIRSFPRRPKRALFDLPTTKELLTMLGVVAAILVDAASADNFDAPRAWTLVAVVASGYMVSRGLAKSGSRHIDIDR